MKLRTNIFVFLLFFISCNQPHQRLEVRNELPDDQMEIDIDSLNNVVKNSKAISQVYEISKDSIFAVRHYGGLIYSINGGENWNRSGDFYGIKDFVISEGGIWVGLGFWVGIHEPDYSKLFISKNSGKDWEIIEFDTKNFFPTKIISKPHKKLKIQTFSKEVFELVNDDFLNGWKKIDFVENNSKQSSMIKYNDRNNRNVFLYTKDINDELDTIAKLKLFTEIDTLLSVNNFTYINGSGYKIGEDARFACFAILNEHKTLKEFKFPGSYSYMKRTDSGSIFLYNDEGIFQVEKDTLIQIF